MHAIDLSKKLATFSKHWHPRVVGQINGYDLAVAKVTGELALHRHEDTDGRRDHHETRSGVTDPSVASPISVKT